MNVSEPTRQLHTGDCLRVMAERVADGAVDLAYLDPPFNSKASYDSVLRTRDGVRRRRAFNDAWVWTADSEREFAELAGLDGASAPRRLLETLLELYGPNDLAAYLVHLTRRLLELRRALRPGATLYLHCDPSAGHYLKVLLDAVFGAGGFRNEIVWCYTGPSAARRDFPRKHDTLLRYTKGDGFTFNADEVRVPYKALHTDRGRPEGRIWKSRGRLRDAEVRAAYLEQGKLVEDYWLDIPSGGHISVRERLGYPTQKPLKLLRRIITASSNPGGVVLDPFAGSGTTAAAAEELGRGWICIDINPDAVELTRQRLERGHPGIEIETGGL